MAAYSAVISLLQTLDQRRIHQLFHSHTAETLDSLCATAEYFFKFFDEFEPGKIKPLEEKIRDAAGEAEDVLEMKISQIIKGSGWTFGMLQDQDLLKVVKKMDTTKKQVTEIVSHDADDQVSGDSMIGTSSTSYPMLEDDVVRGLDDDLEFIVKRLTGHPRDLDVVTISGMGGIGKITLARKAYHHQAIRYHFDILAWVTISQEFRYRNVLLEALHCISKQTDIVNSTYYDKLDESNLADLVQKSLKGQRYLVVVDDIWSRAVWDSIRGIFPNFKKGCRILLTTRETEVAVYASTCSPHEMSLLSLENGWRLLCDIVFGPKHEHTPELEDEVDAQTLILLWIAEGFIRTSENGKSLEEVAEHYLEDLISRNLIQARKRRFNGEIKECGIHDLLREFCLIEAEMTKHMHVRKTHPILPTQKQNFRSFSFQTVSYSVNDCCKLLPPVARSILLFSQLDLPFEKSRELAIHEFFSHFNLLRVLAIFNTQFESFPLVITKLFHLRYLQVKSNGDIPESISRLRNLQTLICHGSCSLLPGKIWTMKNLRYIHMKRPSYLPSPRTEHLVTGMPNLEEFSVLSYLSCTNEVFCGIPNLKRLIILTPFLVSDQSLPQFFDMSILTKLEVLKLSVSLSLNDPFKRLVFPTSLRRLSIKRCYFDWADISSTVMMLPNLEELKLKDCIDKFKSLNMCDWRMSDKDKFKSLKFLLLRGANLVHWEASSDNFPNLKRLVLKNCYFLQEIPADFGEICTLESIELHNCSTTAKESARKIEQEQVDMGNNSLKIYIHETRSDICFCSGEGLAMVGLAAEVMQESIGEEQDREEDRDLVTPNLLNNKN